MSLSESSTFSNTYTISSRTTNLDTTVPSSTHCTTIHSVSTKQLSSTLVMALMPKFPETDTNSQVTGHPHPTHHRHRRLLADQDARCQYVADFVRLPVQDQECQFQDIIGQTRPTIPSRIYRTALCGSNTRISSRSHARRLPHSPTVLPQPADHTTDEADKALHLLDIRQRSLSPTRQSQSPNTKAWLTQSSRTIPSRSPKTADPSPKTTNPSPKATYPSLRTPSRSTNKQEISCAENPSLGTLQNLSPPNRLSSLD